MRQPEKPYPSRFFEKLYPSRFRVASFLLFVLFAVASVELLSYQFLHLQLNKHPRLFRYTVDEHMVYVTDARIRDWTSGTRAYRADAELGWMRSENQRSTSPLGWTLTTDELGARVIPGQDGAAWLSAYGDSFTEGVEVRDDETWPAQLVKSVHGSVLNFGVAGYGPDQALLFLERNLGRGIHTPLVILAVIEEDLDRNLNTFRPFYSWPRLDLVLGFKPRFIPDPSGNFSLRNTGPEIWDSEAVRSALEAAADIDYYYPRRTEDIRFPYSVSAAGFVSRQGFIPERVLPRETPLARSTMSFLIERFAQLADAHDFTPILVLLPSSGEQIRLWNTGYQDVLTPLVAAFGLENLLYINVIRALAEQPDYLAGLQTEDYIQGQHASPQGNAAIARVLGTELAQLIHQGQ